MSIGLALSNSLTGLRVNQRSIAVLSNNIANVNTEGYSRQTVSQSAVIVEGVGSGVAFNDVIRKVDKYLQRAVQENSSLMNTASIVSDYTSRVQVLLGEPGSTNSMDEYVNDFFQSLQVLAETPERASSRSNVVASATTVARELSGLANNIYDLQFQAESDMKDAVTAMNALIKKLDSVNATITRASALGQSTAGLLDERDKALGELSQYVDLNTFFDSDGRVNVFTANGIALVDGGNRHEITFSARTSLESFINGDSARPVSVVTYDSAGRTVGQPQDLISAGVGDEVTTKLLGGKLKGLQEVRDDILPEILSQIDMFSSRLRDEVNRVHNQGVGFPAATSYTGTRAVRASEVSDWGGRVQIAVLNPLGNPIPAGYSDETYTGVRPLTIDLAALNSGSGAGKATVQSIIDEINNYYGAPAVKAHVGALNSIQLASNTDALPNTAPSTFNFDFDVENLTDGTANFFVKNVTVLDDTATDITNVTTDSRRFTLSSTNTYQVTAGVTDVTVSLAGPDVPAVGETIYIADPGTLPANIGGIANSNYTGYFTVKSVSGTDVVIEIANPPLANDTVNQAGMEALPPYDNIIAGEKTRTTNSGTFTANLGGSPASAYYDITVDIGVIDADGNVQNSTITYRVPNNTKQMRNDRYNPTGLTGDGQLVLPYSSQETMRAILVDENGVELPKQNGQYIDAPGYLKLISNNSEYTIAIDSLDSKQLGNSLAVPQEAGTGRGFSHYFELNNLFVSNEPTKTGDTVAGSALNMALEQRIKDNPNLLATGKLVQSPQPADTSALPQYTYIRYSGDNTVAQSLAKLASDVVSFDAAGSLPVSSLTLTGYLGEMIGNISSQAAAADADYSNAETLYNGFKSRLDAVTGVNLDEELANTIVYQNAYTASAKVVKVADEMYQDLLNLF